MAALASLLHRGRRLGRLALGRPEPFRLHRGKTQAIDFAFERLGVRSFADLGAVWAVDGGYTLYALCRHGAERAVLVDEDITPAVRRHARRHPQLSLVAGNFGAPDMPARVGPVDAVVLFDVLLHQVAPDWDEVLAMYARVASVFVISNPQLTSGGHTLRLLEQGPGRYAQLVPPGTYPPDIFERLDEMVPGRGRPWRDVHEVWQWGITDNDLLRTMDDLGFAVAYSANLGRWRGIPEIEDHAFVFQRGGHSPAAQTPAATSGAERPRR
jgi:hypothetical protein